MFLAPLPHPVAGSVTDTLPDDKLDLSFFFCQAPSLSGNIGIQGKHEYTYSCFG